MRRGLSLKALNTWNAGGDCELYSAPRAASDVRDVIREAKESGVPLYILGGGSNVLIDDGVLSVAVLHTVNLNELTITNDTQTDEFIIRAGAGVLVKRLLALALENNIGGLEFLTGIPGTLGGALWGSAGAAGESLAGAVESVETIDFDGNAETIRRDGLNWGYRRCPLDARRTLLAASCVMRLRPSSRGEITERVRRFAKLKKGQPLGRKTAGCVFKNPDGDSAGRLLDACGCKGLRFGGAAVSESHANFIENMGDATARDIYRLCGMCRERVFERYGVRLEYEIRFIGGFEEIQAAH